MSEETRDVERLIRDVVATFIDRPEAIKLVAKHRHPLVQWTMQVHADDQPKMIGVSGCHIKALSFLVGQMGNTSGKTYTFKLLEPEPTVRRGLVPTKPVIHYDPKEATELLARMVTAITGTQGQIEVEREETASTFMFTINSRGNADYAALTVPPFHYDPMQSVVGALGTLWRAWAKKDGVTFRVRVATPVMVMAAASIRR